jgi:hypothetical protein
VIRMKRTAFLRNAPVFVVVGGLAVLGSAAEARTCAPASARDQVEATVRGLFVAAAADDDASWAKLLGPDFYAYDAGKRFDGPQLLATIKESHKSGRKLQWHIEDVEVHVDCDWAWENHVNRGAVGDANGMQPMNWLESTVLTYRKGQWRVVFLHSTRSPPQS